MSTESLTNRHIAKLLDNLEALTDMPPLTKTAVKQEMFWLSQDIEKHVQQEAKREERENGRSSTH